jgi:HD-like signal output (HDOD) protein
VVATAREDVLKALLDKPDLPTLPDVVIRLYATIDNEESSADDLTCILSEDPAITSRLLRLANSAFFHTRFPIETVRQAVVIIGFEGIRSLALATSVLSAFGSRDQQIFKPRDFWLHSLGAARAAEMLVHASPECTFTEAAFTAGLLHDIGRYALAINHGEQYQAIVSKALADHDPLHEVEQAELGISGAEAGAWMLRLWGLPAWICSAVAYQHRPDSYEGPGQADVRAVSLASQFSAMAGFAHAGEEEAPTLPLATLERVGIGEATGNEILDLLRAQRSTANDMLELMQC